MSPKHNKNHEHNNLKHDHHKEKTEKNQKKDDDALKNTVSKEKYRYLLNTLERWNVWYPKAFIAHFGADRVYAMMEHVKTLTKCENPGGYMRDALSKEDEEKTIPPQTKEPPKSTMPEELIKASHWKNIRTGKIVKVRDEKTNTPLYAYVESVQRVNIADEFVFNEPISDFIPASEEDINKPKSFLSKKPEELNRDEAYQWCQTVSFKQRETFFLFHNIAAKFDFDPQLIPFNP